MSIQSAQVQPDPVGLSLLSIAAEKRCQEIKKGMSVWAWAGWLVLLGVHGFLCSGLKADINVRTDWFFAAVPVWLLVQSLYCGCIETITKARCPITLHNMEALGFLPSGTRQAKFPWPRGANWIHRAFYTEDMSFKDKSTREPEERQALWEYYIACFTARVSPFPDVWFTVQITIEFVTALVLLVCISIAAINNEQGGQGFSNEILFAFEFVMLSALIQIALDQSRRYAMYFALGERAKVAKLTIKQQAPAEDSGSPEDYVDTGWG